MNMTTQPWEKEMDEECDKWERNMNDPQGMAGGISPDWHEVKSFITSTRLSAYKEGQRDMKEEVEEKVTEMRDHCKNVVHIVIEETPYKPDSAIRFAAKKAVLDEVLTFLSSMSGEITK